MRSHAKAPSAAPTSSRGRGLATVLLFAFVLLLVPAGALAVETHPHQGTIDPSATPNGAFGVLGGLAVDGSGNLYATDVTGAPDSSGAVDVFDPSGAFLSQITGANTPQGALSFFEPSFLAAAVAVDSSGGPSDGNVYVTDTANNLVDAFDPATNELVAGFGTAGQLNGETTPKLSFSLPCGLAVDQSSGELYVADWGNNRIWVYDGTGAFLRGISDSGLNGPCSIALDSADNLYVRNANDGKVLKFDSAADFQGFVYAPNENDPENPADDDPPASAVAVNLADNHLFLDAGNRILEFEESGGLLRSFGQTDLSSSGGIAADSGSGKVYAADGQTLHVFGALALLPDATTGEASALTDATATLNGSVDPAGGPEAECEFEYGPDTSYGSTAPCVPAGPHASFQEVSAELSGLSPRTTYHYRLSASSVNGESPGEDRTFITTGLPVIGTTFSTAVTSTAATLEATIDPSGSPTSYRFEYVSDAEFGANGFLNATRTPSADAPIGAGPEPVSVSRNLIELQPDTTYRYRVVATNEVGSVTGETKSFRTFAAPSAEPDTCPNAAIRIAQGASNVGDCRAYEMVSPLDKNGGDVISTPVLTRAAADGSAVSFTSFSGFADAAGGASPFDYMGVRTPQGWATHALAPRQEPVTAERPLRLPGYLGDFSDDLSNGVVFAFSSLTDEPAAATTTNLYLRQDLRTPGAGSYRLLTVPEVPLPPFGTPPNDFENEPKIADASADFGHVIFESKMNLTAEASGNFVKLYEWVDGDVRLAGILPDGQPAMCPEPADTVCSAAGASAYSGRYTSSTISGDGSRIFFTSPVGSDGTAVAGGQLYMRVNGSETAHINASEQVPPTELCTNQEMAQFGDASADGLRVFFTAIQPLTEDDVDCDRDLYEYDASLPDSDPHNLTRLSVDNEPADGGVLRGVIGASEDGEYVYFIATNQLVAGAPPVENHDAIYLAHDGALRYIGYMYKGGHDANTLLTGSIAVFGPKGSRVSADGRRMVFLAAEGQGLTGNPHAQNCPHAGIEGCLEVYAYDAGADGGAGALVCASCPPDGSLPSAFGSTFRAARGDGFRGGGTHLYRALTTDGKRVFFTTRERLLAGDRNGTVQDVYEYDIDAGALHLISSGTGAHDAYFLEASASGDDVFIGTRDQLVGADTDNGVDIYDARVGGGFPEPPPASVCEGDACLVAPVGPNDPTPASASFSGAGNAKPPARRRCRKGSKRVSRKGKARCVKRKHNRSAKRAKHERRTSR